LEACEEMPMIRRFVFLVVVALLPAWLVLKKVFGDAVRGWKADTRHDPKLTWVFWRRVLTDETLWIVCGWILFCVLVTTDVGGVNEDPYLP
jgi:hypothetical protein